MTRWARTKGSTRLAASLLTLCTGAAIVAAPAAHADDTALVPLLIKGTNTDYGKELSPNRYRIGPDGLKLTLRWETNDGDAVAAYCHEVAKILDGSGNVVFERQQDLGGGCRYGGNWGATLKGLGNYLYVLDVTDRDTGENFHAELPFEVVLF